MNRNKVGRAGLALALVSLLALASVALAQGQEQASRGGYGLSWWTADGGGVTFSGGGGYRLGGTAGQPDAGPALTSGAYTLAGGFWSGAGAGYRVYLPMAVKNW